MRGLLALSRGAGLLLAALLAAGCSAPARSAATATTARSTATRDGTAEMAALLKQRAAAADPSRLVFPLNDRRAKLLGEQLKAPLRPGQRVPLEFAYALELLQAGENEAALQAADTLEEDVKAVSPALWEAKGSAVLILKATAWLRMAEEQNCHQGNTPESCLLPIRGGGIHLKREGATRATEVLNGVLDHDPKNLEARWLLNVAYMTLGDYPARVPRSRLIPPAVFASGHPLPRFENTAARVGVDVYGLSGGAVLDDYDGDGHLDLVLSAIGFDDPLRFFHNRGDGTFEDRTAQSGLQGITGGLNMVQADYDNDGRVDILVLRGAWMRTEGRFPLSLLRNQGGGRFIDVTKAAGLLRFDPTQTAAWFDYDGDGWLDLFVGNESTPGAGTEPPDPHPCQLFHNNRDGTFTEVARASGVALVGYVKGVVSGDYDNDGRPDLYVSIQRGNNVLLHNEGPGPGGAWRFTDVAPQAGVTEPKGSFGTFFFDYDNDGWPDLWVSGFDGATGGDAAAAYLGLPTPAARGRLYRNKGDGTFEDVTHAAGVDTVAPAMGLNFGDLDNDGYLDFYLGTGTPNLATLVPNRMFRNAQGRTFQDVTTAGGFGHLQKGHAIVFGDADEDGDQDVFEVMGGAFQADRAYSAFYQNPGNPNHWLKLDLEGVRSNRSAIGARIKVAAVTKDGPRLLYRTVGSGGSFGASPLGQEIGLADATAISSVEIVWPAPGPTQTLEGLQLDHRYRVREGQPAVAVAAGQTVAAAQPTSRR